MTSNSLPSYYIKNNLQKKRENKCLEKFLAIDRVTFCLLTDKIFGLCILCIFFSVFAF